MQIDMNLFMWLFVGYRKTDSDIGLCLILQGTGTDGTLMSIELQLHIRTLFDKVETLKGYKGSLKISLEQDNLRL